MPLRVLIAPDKFKGTLTAIEAAQAIAKGWRKVRPGDRLTLLPMSDGGDGFGEILAGLLGARAIKSRTVDAAHRPLSATWWWEPRSRTAIIESARIIGLAMLPEGKFHPFQLDTFGLGAVLRAVVRKGSRRCILGIGGSATNDGGFGLARALGWRFRDNSGEEITKWTGLPELRKVERAAEVFSSRRKKTRSEAGIRQSLLISVAVDVQNRMLGARGCTRVFGPQKGLRPADFSKAEAALRQLAAVSWDVVGHDFSKTPGAGAAGGLGFGLMAFAGANAESGFMRFAKQARLAAQIRRADVVVTGEGSLDKSTLMGKGVGELAALCRKLGKPCVGISGRAGDRALLNRRFSDVYALIDSAPARQAMSRPAFHVQKTAALAARKLASGFKSGLR